MNQRRDQPLQRRARRHDQASSGSPGKTPMTAAIQRSANALPAPVQAKMEAAFGTDFSGVQVHEDGEAQAIGAEAYASGEELHFAPGRYDPHSESGQALIAHELAHVEQQRAGRVGGNGVVVDASLEQEADDLGARAARGETVASSGSERGHAGSAVVQGSGIKQAYPTIILPPAVMGLMTMGAELWAWAGTEATATALATMSTVVGAGSGLVGGIGTAIAPGANGVQDYCIQSWKAEGVDESLAQIIQVKLINRFVEMWLAQSRAGATPAGSGPATPPVTGAPVPGGPATTPPVTGAPVPGGPAPAPPVTGAPVPGGPATALPEVDPALVEMIKEAVRLEVSKKIKQQVAASIRNLSTSEEFKWDDGGIPGMGTRCAIRWKNVQAYRIVETLALSSDAMKIPACVASGLNGQTAELKGIIRGDLVKGSWIIGYGDSLGINVQSQSSELGGVWVNTRWEWDGNSTYLTLGIAVGDDGMPVCTEISRETPDGGLVPDDNSWF